MNNKIDTIPLVSIIIPMFNEYASIDKCIESILNQDYPQQQIEILVVDGGSTDGCREKVAERAKLHPQIRLLDNPQRVTPKSLNIGIKNARGEIVIILGAHTTIKEDFVRQNVSHIQQLGVKCVGGTQINVGETFIHRAIGYAMGSPFGFASAPYRYWKKEKFVDTVVYAAYKKELFDEIGYFDEESLISEDAEFNWRIRKAGYQIFYTPKIVSYYYPRKNIFRLINQLFRYGILRVNVVKKHIDAIKLMHLVPPMFILITIAFLILGFYKPIFTQILILIWSAYLFYIVIASLMIGKREGLKYLIVLPIIFISIHLSWGLGFILGIFKSRYKFA